jgi:hypothetical protein
MNSAASVFSQLSTLGNTPKQMITGFFKSMDEAVDLYNSLVDSWDHDMSFANIRVAEDVEAQMGALAQTADFFHKLDDLKPDYSSSIRGFFNHLKVAMNEMATAMPQFAQQMNPETDKIAKFMKNQGDALNAALAPILNVEQAAFVYPEDIDRSMENVKRLMARFSELGNDPALQGDNLANIKLFSSQMGEIFGNLSTVVEGANLMGAPGEDGQGITFASTMETFFNVDVVNYGILWHNVMMGMAEDSEMMAGRTITALGNTPMSGAGSGKSLVASGGNNYTNCIIVNGSVVAEGEDISTLVKKMSQYDTVRQGGVPVGMER